MNDSKVRFGFTIGATMLLLVSFSLLGIAILAGAGLVAYSLHLEEPKPARIRDRIGNIGSIGAVEALPRTNAKELESLPPVNTKRRSKGCLIGYGPGVLA